METISHLALLVVFDYLSVPDLLVAASVCRRWRAVLDDPQRWYHYDVEDKWLYTTHAVRSADLASVRLAVRRMRVGPVGLRYKLFEWVGHNPRIDVVQWMTTESGATIEDLRELYMKPIEWACLGGHADTARWLIDYFAITKDDLHCHIGYGIGAYSGIFAACWSRDDTLPLASELIDRFGLTKHDALVECNAAVLRAACAGGNLERLMQRLDISASECVATEDACSALWHSCDDTGADQLRWLLDQVSIETELAYRLLCWACERGSLRLVQWLVTTYDLSRAQIPSRLEPDGAVECACIFERGDIVRWLVGAGFGWNPSQALIIAISKNDENIFGWLMTTHTAAVVQAIRNWAASPICAATMYGRPEMLERLLELNAHDSDGLKDYFVNTSWPTGGHDKGAYARALKLCFASAGMSQEDKVQVAMILLRHVAYAGETEMLRNFIEEFGLHSELSQGQSSVLRTAVRFASMGRNVDTYCYLLEQYPSGRVYIGDSSIFQLVERQPLGLLALTPIVRKEALMVRFSHGILCECVATGNLRLLRQILVNQQPTPYDLQEMVHIATRSGEEDILGALMGLRQ